MELTDENDAPANVSAATTATGHVCPTCGHLHFPAVTFEVHLGDTSVIPPAQGDGS